VAVTGSQQHVFAPGSKLSFKSAAAITKGRLVEITSANTVQMAAAKSQKVVGVAMQSCDAVGDLIEVQVLGYVFRLTAQGAVSAGDELVVGTVAGSVATQAAAAAATLTDINNARAVIGIALEAISDTAQGRVLVSRA
jgi:hypothetical protein